MSIERNSQCTSKQLLTAVVFSVTGFCCVYALQVALHLPGLLYDPEAHSWLTGTRTVGVQMRYFNNLATASAAGIAISVLRLRWRRPATPGLVLAYEPR